MNFNEQRKAYIQLCGQFQPNTFITLATNQTLSTCQMKKKMDRFFGHMDRKLMGHTWLQQPISMRTDGIGFIEHINSNIHAHLLVRFNKGNEWGRAKYGEHYWRKICESGSVEIKPISDTRQLASYCSKEMVSRSFDPHEQIVLLRDFMPT